MKISLNIQIDYTGDLIHIEQPLKTPGDSLGPKWLVPFSPLLAALRECGYQITEPPSLLYNQVKEYILTTWSKSCVKVDVDHLLLADNGHRYIRFENQRSSTPFLILHEQRKDVLAVVFEGYIRSIEDFKLILELTSVQKPS